VLPTNLQDKRTVPVCLVPSHPRLVIGEGMGGVFTASVPENNKWGEKRKKCKDKEMTTCWKRIENQNTTFPAKEYIETVI